MEEKGRIKVAISLVLMSIICVVLLDYKDGVIIIILMINKSIEPRIKRQRATFVFGCSHLGASIANLLNEKDEDVIIIDQDIFAFNKLPESFGGLKHVGDILDLNFLESVEIQSAKRVIIVTDDDNVNLLSSHICYYIFHIQNVYVRLFDLNKGELLTESKIKAFYPFTLSRDNLISLMEEED